MNDDTSYDHPGKAWQTPEANEDIPCIFERIKPEDPHGMIEQMRTCKEEKEPPGIHPKLYTKPVFSEPVHAE